MCNTVYIRRYNVKSQGRNSTPEYVGIGITVLTDVLESEK